MKYGESTRWNCRNMQKMSKKKDGNGSMASNRVVDTKKPT